MITDPPACPVTGEPAVRLVQWVGAGFLANLWRHTFRVDVRPSFRGTKRFGLWQSPTGLYFFDPMTEGDAAFYEALYRLLPKGSAPREGYPREEFRIAARHVTEGARVLDVGCGSGAFRHVVPGARYTGLDPHADLASEPDWLCRESLAEHVDGRVGFYDCVCAFQVLEHVAAPMAMLAEMARAAVPGGKVVVGVPHVPSAHTRIPNYLINAPPHHLTWWTKAALEAAAAQVGLVKASVQTVPWGEVDAIVYWMERCSPVRCREVHYRHAWIWHASALAGFLGGLAMRKVPAPRRAGDEGASLLLVAEAPARHAVPERGAQIP